MKGVLAGFHAVGGRLKRAPESISVMYIDEGRQDARLRDLVRQAEAAGVKVATVPRARLEGLAGGLRHQGVIAQAEEVQSQALDVPTLLDSLNEPPFLLLLDGVTDPHNLGACLRVADGAGAHAVIAPKDKSAPLNDVAIRTAAGAADAVPYIQVTNLARTIEYLQGQGVFVFGAAGEATQTLWEADLRGPVALVLGAEGDGLRRLTRERCDVLIKLPMRGQCESLNVSVAAGICLYEVRRRRG